jgi:hypothetical protein
MELDCTGFHVQHCIEAYVALMRAHGASGPGSSGNLAAYALLLFVVTRGVARLSCSVPT